MLTQRTSLDNITAQGVTNVERWGPWAFVFYEDGTFAALDSDLQGKTKSFELVPKRFGFPRLLVEYGIITREEYLKVLEWKDIDRTNRFTVY